MSEITVAIAGLTGKLASRIAVELLKRPNVMIHGICRNPSKLSNNISTNPQVKIFQADCTDRDKIQAAVKGAQVCICGYLGGPDVLVDGQKILIDACIAGKVPRYIASDYSFDFRGLKLGDVPTKDFQLLIKNYLDEKEAQGLIKGVHIMNGAFMEVLFAPFFGAYDADAQAIRTWGTGNEVLETTAIRDIASFTAVVALDPMANGFVGILGDRKTAREVTMLYKKVYGEPLHLDIQGSTQDLLDNATATMKQDPRNIFAWFPKLLYYYMLNGATLLKSIDEEKAKEVGPMDLEAFLSANKKESLATLKFD